MNPRLVAEPRSLADLPRKESTSSARPVVTSARRRERLAREDALRGALRLREAFGIGSHTGSTDKRPFSRVRRT